MSEIQIEVQGRLGIVNSLVAAPVPPRLHRFVVGLMFWDDPLPGGITSMSVFIPGKRYERDKFIETVIKAAEAELAKNLKQQRKKEAIKLEDERFERYTKKMAKELGIE